MSDLTVNSLRRFKLLRWLEVCFAQKNAARMKHTKPNKWFTLSVSRILWVSDPRKGLVLVKGCMKRLIQQDRHWSWGINRGTAASQRLALSRHQRSLVLAKWPAYVSLSFSGSGCPDCFVVVPQPPPPKRKGRKKKHSGRHYISQGSWSTYGSSESRSGFPPSNRRNLQGSCPRWHSRKSETCPKKREGTQ